LEAKIVIKEGQVLVNGEVEYQRGKKLYEGDMVSFNGETIKILK
jgi:ribosome-associated protein